MHIKKAQKTPITFAFGRHFNILANLAVPADTNFFQDTFQSACAANNNQIIVVGENGPTYELYKAASLDSIRNMAKDKAESIASAAIKRASTFLASTASKMSEGIRATDPVTDMGYEEQLLLINSASPRSILLFFEPQIANGFWPYFDYLYYQSRALNLFLNALGTNSSPSRFRAKKLSPQENEIIAQMKISIERRRTYHRLRDQCVVDLITELKTKYPHHAQFVARGSAHNGLQERLPLEDFDIEIHVSSDYKQVRPSDRTFFVDIEENSIIRFSIEELFYHVYFRSITNRLSDQLNYSKISDRTSLYEQITNEANLRTKKALEAFEQLKLNLVDAYCLGEK